MQQKKKGDLSRVSPDPNEERENTNREGTTLVVKSLSEQYNEAFAKPHSSEQKVIDGIRWRKNQLNVNRDILDSFFMEIGKRLTEEGKRTYLVENDFFVTIWVIVDQETIKG